MPAWSEYKEIAKSRGALALEVYVVHTTPAGSPEDVKAALPDHLAYQRQLEEAGVLMMAGPISDATGEQMQGAGMCLYRAASMEAARGIADQDPMHKSGARTYRLHKWLINEGALNVSLGLSTGRTGMS